MSPKFQSNTQVACFDLNANTKESDMQCSEQFGFVRRHIGPRPEQLAPMLREIGVSSLQELIEKTVPRTIFNSQPLSLPEAKSESAVLAELRGIAGKNKLYRSFIGQGYHGCFTPPVIQRKILENPAWYTQYTPYQAEISQGRLEALLNFQTMVCELTQLELANASLLDEGTAAAEAMAMCARVLSGKRQAKKFLVSQNVHPQTISLLQTRAEPLGIELEICDFANGSAQCAAIDAATIGALVQYPSTDGAIADYRPLAQALHAEGAYLVVAADILSLLLLEAPGTWGADICLGSTQRFGVPMFFGGPHAAFLAASSVFQRELPGRVVGLSKDRYGKPAIRLALQTREQHIKRERATSNICTAQVLLAVIASMYAVYHGPEGLKNIAVRLNRLTQTLAKMLAQLGFVLKHENFFDTLCLTAKSGRALDSASIVEIRQRSAERNLNLRYYADASIGVTLDEMSTCGDLVDIVYVLSGARIAPGEVEREFSSSALQIPQCCQRTTEFLRQDVFNIYRSETQMLRYIAALEAKDLSLTHSMIPLGSCTMKLNAACEMQGVSWPEFAGLHPFAPVEQTAGYRELVTDLERYLAAITGLPGVSLQPNAGSQGEYAGLLVIRAYFASLGQSERNVCLIPSSAHGTNPATAAMAGLEIVIVASTEDGCVDLSDLRQKAEQYKARLATLMITYPSTHGVFEEEIREICEIIHAAGGQVYMDGANLNAQVGLCRPGDFGVDVCHINLHKTFCIPHGGGGPGVGPIAAAKHLAPFLPGHPVVSCGGEKAIGPVSAAPWGSAGILLIPWAYIRLMGAGGLGEATKIAILNANYIAARLQPYFPVLYRGKFGFVAHECILDLRTYKRSIGIEVADVAKRLMDYGFHAPTVSFPVPETLMVEPTESESLEELDRFCQAMIAIYHELQEIAEGRADAKNNVLKNAPHTAEQLASEEWSYPYSREKAVYPLPWLKERKFWPAVSRIDAAFGDRNFCCTI